MEIVQVQKKELQKAESTPSKNGELAAIETACAQPHVTKTSLKEIDEMLRYCMLLVGIRAQNLPSKEESQVLVNYILTWLNDYSIQSYKLAFELAVAGKLDVEADCYENFSTLYISKIMRAYRKYSNSMLEFKERSFKLAELPPTEYDPRQFLNIVYKEFLAEEINWTTLTDNVYDIAYKHCNMNFTEKELILIIQQAKHEVLAQYHGTKKLDVIKQLKDLPIGIACKNDDVNHLAKIKCLQKWFEGLKKKSVKVIIEEKK